MNLYKILVEHAGPKDSHKSIEAFIIASNDEEVYNWIDKEKKYGGWTETEEDEEIFDIYDDNYNVIGKESYKEKILRLNGDIDDEDNDYSDAYYGLTFYGWEKISSNITGEKVTALKELGILPKVINAKNY